MLVDGQSYFVQASATWRRRSHQGQVEPADWPNWKATQPTANGKLLHGSADVWFKAFFPPATACRAGH